MVNEPDKNQAFRRCTVGSRSLPTGCGPTQKGLKTVTPLGVHSRAAVPTRAATVLYAAAAVVLVLNVSVWLAGAAPREVMLGVLAGTLGSGYGVGQVLSKATPLIFAGASVAFALRARLFNIGAEGQGLAGVLTAALVGAALPAATPALVAVPVCLAAAALGGGALGALAGWLRGRFGTHEVLSTLMLNGLTAVLTTWLYAGPLRMGAQVHTRPVVPGARLPMLGAWVGAFRGSGVNLALVLAVVAAVGAEVYLRRTRGGLAIRAVGSSPGAAEALGVDVARARLRAMTWAGALAGLTASHLVLGVKGYAEQGLGVGVGFVGLAVALLGTSGPGAVVLGAVLFGVLAQGALAVNAMVPPDVLTVAQAATMVAAAAVGAATLRARSAA